MNSELIRSVFDESEIELVKNAIIKDRRHPVKRMLFPTERDSQVVANTERALKHILRADKKWILSLKPRLLNRHDYSEPSSALAEIRSYGSLLESEVAVKPRKTPDFVIEDSEEEICVEVHSKQLQMEEAEALERFHTETFQTQDPPRTVRVREHVVTPFGEPREGENVTENVISKLASIKQDEHQFSETNTSILWLDFQDEAWDLLMNANMVLPVRTWNGEFFSGEFWYAFYGWKGAPIFQGNTTELRVKSRPIKMRHEGYFRRPTKLDAVVISLARDTIILENPHSTKPIKPSLWRRLIFIPWFRFGYSYGNWPKRDLKQRILLQQEMLRSLSGEAIYGW